MNKQIEEMWNIITTDCDRECAGCEFENDEWCFTHRVVKELYNVGYRKQSKWISVDERLPERNGRYLTHCNIEGQSLVCVLFYCKIGGFNEGAVTHWMPLPEPPRMKGGAE